MKIQIKYFDKENLICEGALFKTPEKIVTKGRGLKGKLLDVYTLAKPFQPYLNLWMEERKRLGIRSEWLFPKNENGKWVNKPIRTATLDYWAKTFSTMIHKHFYWHSMRHYFTTKLSEANLPDSVIQDIVGWESIEMVSVYVDTSADKKLDKYFGADGFKEVQQTELKEL